MQQGILFALAALLLNCATQIPNLKSHVSLPDETAYYKYLNTQSEGFLNETTWKSERIGMICHYPEDFGEVLKLFEKVCEQLDNCTFEEEERNRIESFLEFARSQKNDQ